MMGIFLIVLACCLWAIDTLIRYPLLANGVSAERIVFTEHILLVAVFLPLIMSKWKKIWSLQVSHLFYFFMIGGVGSAAATLAFTKAFALVNPSAVILLQKFQPIVAIIMARIVLQESLKREFLLWAGLCLVGGLMITHHDLVAGLKELLNGDHLSNPRSLQGYAFAGLAVMGWGMATVFGKKLTLQGLSPKEIMAGRFFFGFLCLLPLPFMTDLDFDLAPWTWGRIAVMVFLSGLLAMYFYYRGLHKISARAAALAEMFFPFCAISVNWIFLNKALDPVQLLGGALLLIAATVIQLKHY